MKLLLISLLKLHTFVYRLINVLVAKIEPGKHPKHRIINYPQWFKENIDNSSIIIDIGCGTGHLSKYLSSKAKKVFAIDKNKHYIDQALRKYSSDNIEYICSDALKYPYTDLGSIEFVILSNVLEHIENRIEFLNTLRNNIIWLESPCFLIRVPLLTRDWLSVYKKQMHVDYRLDPTHVIEYTKSGFIEEIEKAGLEIASFSVDFGEIYAVCLG